MEPIACFMVDGLDDTLDDHGNERVGAMFWWTHQRTPLDVEPKPFPHLAVTTPLGPVCLDCPATSGAGYWTRTGRPPRITVTPSIDVNHGGWHGFLSGGHLRTL